MSMHIAKVLSKWHGSFNGKGVVQAAEFATTVSLPIEFGGLGQGASPEDLFLSAIASCYIITLGIVLDKAGVKHHSLEVDGKLLTKTGPASSIEEILLNVSLTTDSPQATIESLAARVNDHCLIGKAIRADLKKTVRIVCLNKAN